MARGPHVILLHQHSDADADERIALLERVITGYYLLFAAQGLELEDSSPPGDLLSASGSPIRKTTWISTAKSEDADGVLHHAWLLSPDLEGRGCLRRTQQRRAANGSK